MVRAPELVGRVERESRWLCLERGLAHVDDRVVVVEGGGLVGIDRPVCSARHLRGERSAREGMVEASGLTVEDVRMRIRSRMAEDQVDEIVRRSGHVVGAREEDSNGVFAAVAVEIADDQEIRISARGRIGGEPIDERPGGGAPRSIAIALTIAGIEVPEKDAARALRLQVGDGDREASRGRALANGLGQDRAIARGIESGVDGRVEDRVAPRGRDRRGLEEQRDPDRVIPDCAGIHERKGSAAGDRIGRVDEGDRRRPSVVLHLHQAE